MWRVEVRCLEAVKKLDAEEMHDLVGTAVFNEGPGEKDFIGHRGFELSTEPVGQRGSQLCSDETRIAVEPRADDIAGGAVDSGAA